jgi:hypothetical protein
MGSFFFISYQGTRERNGASPNSLASGVLIAPGLTNDFARAPRSSITGILLRQITTGAARYLSRASTTFCSVRLTIQCIKGVALAGQIFDRGLRTAYFQQYNASVQQSLTKDLLSEVAATHSPAAGKPMPPQALTLNHRTGDRSRRIAVAPNYEYAERS